MKSAKMRHGCFIRDVTAFSDFRHLYDYVGKF